MKKELFRKTEEYKKCVEKIKNYRNGFEFDIEYWRMTEPQKNAIGIVLDDCRALGLIKSISIDLSIELEMVEERYRRI